MKARKARARSPVVMSSERPARRRARSGRDEILGAEALEAPVPGSLLVLLSRLMRSERKVSTDDGPAG